MSIGQFDYWLLIPSAEDNSFGTIQSSCSLSPQSWQQGCEIRREWRVATSRLHKPCSFSLFSKGVGGAWTLFQKKNICCWFWGQCQDVLLFKSLIFSCIYFLGGWKGFFLKGFLCCYVVQWTWAYLFKENSSESEGFCLLLDWFCTTCFEEIYIAGRISEKNGEIKCFSEALSLG